MSRLALLSGVIVTVGLVACGDTGQSEVSYPAFALGVDAAPFDVGDWRVTLTEADIAIGPIYFCATAAASADLCPSATAELRVVAVVDGLDPSPQPIGTVEGVTGVINSATYDFGIHWFTRDRSPIIAPEAPGGHSARFAGSATRGETTVPFTIDLDLVPQFQGTRAVQGARAKADIQDDGWRLELRFDPVAWFRTVDFDRLETAADNALVIAITTGQPITFNWVRAE